MYIVDANPKHGSQTIRHIIIAPTSPSNAQITPFKVRYVQQFKHQLLQSIANVLDDVRIQYVISAGGLIKYERNKSIDKIIVGSRYDS